MVGISRINEKIFFLIKSFLQSMEALMFFTLVSNIKLIFTFRRGNIVLFKDLRYLVDGILHAIILWVKYSLAVRALGFVKLLVLVLLGTRGSF